MPQSSQNAASTTHTIVDGNGVPISQVRSPKVPPANPNFSYTGVSGGTTWGVISPKKGGITLRKFSERNVWVRIAINRRKKELARAEWAIVRTDDVKAKPEPNVVKAATELFRFINDTKASFEWMLNVLIEDILVVDAGVCEKEKAAGGKTIALWPQDGTEYVPIVGWDGSDPKKPRYVQMRQGKVIAEYLNDELIYIMANPRTCSPIGLSPLEVLIQTVEADLYGEYFEYELMKETAPAGILYLGGGVPPEKVEAFRMQWQADIAGTRDVAIVGGGGYDPETGTMASPPEFIPFTRSAKDEMRREYMKWLATKVAAAFEMDLMAFNLSEAVHRSVGENLQAKTDQGLLGLASVIQSYITRELIWEIDPTHRHAFEFRNLVPENELMKAKVRAQYMQMGATTPNEIRIEDGKDPFPWGDVPWPMQMQAKTGDPAEPYEATPSGDDKADDSDDDEQKDE